MVRFELREYEEHNEKYSKIIELKCYLLRYTQIEICTQIEIQCTPFSMRERERDAHTHTHTLTYALAMPNAFVRTASTLVELT